MSIIKIPPVPTSGFRVSRLLSNGTVTEGFGAAALASFFNGVAARRGKVLHSYMGPATLGLGGFASAVGHAKFYTGPNCGGVYARVFLAPSAGTTNGTYTFTVNAYANAARYVAVQGGSTYGISDFADLQFDDSELLSAASTPLASSTEYTISITASSNANMIGFILVEVPKASLDTATDLCVDPRQFQISSPVVDSQINALVENAWTLQGHGPHYVYYTWAPNTSFDAPRDFGSTWGNVVDGVTTGWSSTSNGFPYWPASHGTLASNDVPVTYWCYAKVNGGTGEVRFVDDDGTLATIGSITGTSYAYYTTTGNLNSSKSRRLCIIEARHTTGAGALCTVKAGGFYGKR